MASPQTVAHQCTLSMVLPRQEYWSGLPLPSPGDLPEPGIKPASPALAGGFFTTEPPGNPKKINEENSKIQMKKTSNPSSTLGPKIYLYYWFPVPCSFWLFKFTMTYIRICSFTNKYILNFYLVGTMHRQRLDTQKMKIHIILAL